MPAQPHARLRPEEYLAIERAAAVRSEYYNGWMYARSGSSHAHAIIIANLSRRLGNALADRDCLITASDLRIRVVPDGLYTYPRCRGGLWRT